MKLSALGLGLSSLGAFVATVWIARWAGMDELSPLFFDAGLLTKLVDLTLAAALAGVVVIGLLRPDDDKQDGGSPILTLATWAAPALGALAMAYNALLVWEAASQAHVTHLQVVAPGLAEALLPLSLGLLAGAAAAFLNGRQAPVAA